MFLSLKIFLQNDMRHRDHIINDLWKWLYDASCDYTHDNSWILTFDSFFDVMSVMKIVRIDDILKSKTNEWMRAFIKKIRVNFNKNLTCSLQSRHSVRTDPNPDRDRSRLNRVRIQVESDPVRFKQCRIGSDPWWNPTWPTIMWLYSAKLLDFLAL